MKIAAFHTERRGETIPLALPQQTKDTRGGSFTAENHHG